jgi:hypothetical protein
MYLGLALVAVLALGGCATRPVNPPITPVDLNAGYTFQTRQKHFKSQENLVILASTTSSVSSSATCRESSSLLNRPESQRLLKDVGAKIVADPSAGGSGARGAAPKAAPAP